MDKKALYRAKLKEAAQKREKRIDSPLVRYNEYDQPACRVCDVVLKSESLWAAHQASRKHHEAIKNFKTTAAGKTRINDSKSEPSTELARGSRSSSALPADFFDKHDVKRQKTGLSSQDKNETGPAKAPVKSVDSTSSGKTYGKMEDSVQTCGVKPFKTQMDELSNDPSVTLGHTTRKMDGSEAKQAKGVLPRGFFDDKDAEATKEVRQVNRALPDGFFDEKDVDTIQQMGSSEVKQVKNALPEGFFDKKDGYPNRKVDGSEVKQVKGALPEGFFDNKDDDLRARGIEPVKVDIKDEYKEFEKLIQENLHEVDERLVEEEIDAADIREEEETIEQKAYWERVEMLKKKQMELRAGRFGGQKCATKRKDSSDDDSSSDEDSNQEDFAVDWRAKHL